jgi:alkylated DNA repair dioxygenase AlkB
MLGKGIPAARPPPFTAIGHKTVEPERRNGLHHPLQNMKRSLRMEIRTPDLRIASEPSHADGETWRDRLGRGGSRLPGQSWDGHRDPRIRTNATQDANCRTARRERLVGRTFDRRTEASRYNCQVGNSPSAPAVAWQPSLWAEQSTVVDVSFCGLERTQLDEASWVDLCPRWMSGSDRAFEELLRDVAWSQRRRWMYDREVDEPRLTSWQSIDQQTSVASRWLEDARGALSAHYEVRFDSVGFNLYRDGGDSVAWHRDRIPAEVVDPVVALLSLGEPRTFLLRPQGGGKSRPFKLGHGDLRVTGGGTQRRFEHSVPKVKSSGPRMSIAFRHGVG